MSKRFTYICVIKCAIYFIIFYLISTHLYVECSIQLNPNECKTVCASLFAYGTNDQGYEYNICRRDGSSGPSSILQPSRDTINSVIASGGKFRIQFYGDELLEATLCRFGWSWNCRTFMNIGFNYYNQILNFERDFRLAEVHCSKKSWNFIPCRQKTCPSSGEPALLVIPNEDQLCGVLYLKELCLDCSLKEFHVLDTFRYPSVISGRVIQSLFVSQWCQILRTVTFVNDSIIEERFVESVNQMEMIDMNNITEVRYSCSCITTSPEEREVINSLPDRFAEELNFDEEHENKLEIDVNEQSRSRGAIGFLVLAVTFIIGITVSVAVVCKPDRDETNSELNILQLSHSQPSQNNPDGLRWRSPQPLVLVDDPLLGSGSFGQVWKAQHTFGQTYAVKEICLDKALNYVGGDISKLLREVHNASLIENSNVVKYYNCWLEDEVGMVKQLTESFLFKSIQKSKLFIQMELCDFTLKYWLLSNQQKKANTSIKSKRSESEETQTAPELITMLHQMCKGLLVIHEKGILHRDLKPDNIFCKVQSNQLNWKIGDFGLSIQTCPEEEMKRHSKAGSLLYRSPEMSSTDKGFVITEKTDVFSLGLIFLEILHNFKSTREKAQTFGNLRTRRGILKNILAKDLAFPLEVLEGMLAQDVGHRWTISQVHLAFINKS